MEAQIPEYWIVDPEQSTITVNRPGDSSGTTRDTLVWQPSGAPQPLAIDVANVFG